MYEAYKPLRNFLRKQSAIRGLIGVWQAFAWLDKEARRLNRHSLIGDLRYVQPYELALVARELVLNAPVLPEATDLRNLKWANGVSDSVSYLRRISEAISRDTIRSTNDALRALTPLIHQQIPWQEPELDALTRLLTLLKRHGLEELTAKVLGLPLADFVKLCLAVAGALNTHPVVFRSNYAAIVSTQSVDAFFTLVSQPIEQLKERIKDLASYDVRWVHTFNPLQLHPLIRHPLYPNCYLGPVPKYLIWRITEGLYFDLIKDDHFGAKFGKAIEDAVGDSIQSTLKGPVFRVLAEREYSVGKTRKHGADWRIIDGTGHVFVECKAKRLRAGAKAGGHGGEFHDDIAKLAGFIAQNYKNMVDAAAGQLPDYQPDFLPMFNAVVTLEDWRLIFPHLTELVKKLVNERLLKDGLDAGIVNKWPFEVLSSTQFERRIQDVAVYGVKACFSGNDRPHSNRYRPQFPNALADLMPDIAEEAGLKGFAIE